MSDLDALDAADVAARFRRALMPLVRQLRRQVEGDLTPSLMSALATVGRDGPITLGDLATAERVSPPMATKLANTLSDKGLVDRLPCADDRRVVRLRITDDGVAVLTRARERRDAWLAQQFADLGADELRTIAESIAILDRVAR